MTEMVNKEGFILAMDIEKSFDSSYHTFLVSVLKKFGFGTNFIDWIQVLINGQESCVLNARNTTPYFYQGLVKEIRYHHIYLFLH